MKDKRNHVKVNQIILKIITQTKNKEKYTKNYTLLTYPYGVYF